MHPPTHKGSLSLFQAPLRHFFSHDRRARRLTKSLRALPPLGVLPPNSLKMLPYTPSYDKGPSETVSPGEVKKSAAHIAAQTRVHLVDCATSISKKQKMLTIRTRTTVDRPCRTHSPLRPTMATFFVAAAKYHSSTPLTAPVTFPLPLQQTNTEQCGYARRIYVSKKEHKFHNTHPLLFTPCYQFNLSLICFGPRAPKSSSRHCPVHLVHLANPSSARTSRCLPYIGTATSCAPCPADGASLGMSNPVIVCLLTVFSRPHLTFLRYLVERLSAIAGGDDDKPQVRAMATLSMCPSSLEPMQ